MQEVNVSEINESPMPVKMEAWSDECEQAFDNWVRKEVIPEYLAWKADPNAVSYTVDEVLASIFAKDAKKQ